MRKIALALMICLLLPCFASCHEASEMDDTLYVIAIGVDQGVADKWRLTIQFPTMKSGGGSSSSNGNGGNSSSGGGGGDDESGQGYATVDSPSFFVGIDMLNASMPRKLSFAHAQIIVFSEELAQSGLIGEYVAPIGRFSEIRRSSHVFVVKGTAFDFLKENKPTIGTTLSKSFQVFAAASENIGYFPHITLENFYEGLKSPYGQAIASKAAINEMESSSEEGGPKEEQEFKTGGEYLAGELPRDGKNKLELWGTALFNGDKMVGELNGDETRLLLMIRGDFRQGLYVMQDPMEPELIVSLDVQLDKKPQIDIETEGEQPIIRLKFQLDADLLSVQSMIHYENPELRPLLEETFKKNIEEGIAELIQKCQELYCDAFRFGENAAKNFLTIDEFESYDWNRRFHDAKVEVDVDFTIRRTGAQIKSYPIKEPIGEE